MSDQLEWAKDDHGFIVAEFAKKQFCIDTFKGKFILWYGTGVVGRYDTLAAAKGAASSARGSIEW
jgi:hypothetical protein